MRYTYTRKIFTAAAFVPFACGVTQAAEIDTPIPDLPVNKEITLSGSVDHFSDGNNFLLRNENGVIEVRMTSNEAISLKTGENVTVTGVIEKPLWGLFGNDLIATRVQAHPG